MLEPCQLMARDEVDIYRRHVEAEASGDTSPSEVIYNRSASHAAVIIETLFKIAQSSIDIITGRFNHLVYGGASVVHAAREFLLEGGSRVIRIAVESPESINPQTHPFFVMLCQDDLMGRVEVRIVPQSVQALYRYHFALVDGVSYRIEGDRSHFDAVAQFRDPSGGGVLSNRFSEIWGQSFPVVWQPQAILAETADGERG